MNLQSFRQITIDGLNNPLVIQDQNAPPNLCMDIIRNFKQYPHVNPHSNSKPIVNDNNVDLLLQ